MYISFIRGAAYSAYVVRASRPMQRTKPICVRLSPEEKQILKDAAWERKLSLSEWIRQTMLKEARKKP
jgi:uncharacterized protein (DUF1778 family)